MKPRAPFLDKIGVIREALAAKVPQLPDLCPWSDFFFFSSRFSTLLDEENPRKT